MKELLNIREDRAAAVEPRWLETLRDEAARHFEAQGYPTTRREEWRHTNITALVATAFTRPAESGFSVTPEQFSAFEAWPFAGTRIVFVNGRFSPEYTKTDRLPHGIRVESIADILAHEPETLAPWLGQSVSTETHPFAALNTTSFEDGAFVHVGRGCVAEDPIVLLHLSTAPDQPIVSCPRNVIVAEDGSVVSIVEVYAGFDGEVSFTNAVTEISVGDRASLDHYKVQEESAKAFHIGAMAVHQAANSVFSSHSVSLGAALTRNDVSARLDGEHAEATLHGLSVVTGGRHVDNHTVIDHAVPNGASHETYHGILEGKSRNVFCGLVIVRPDAQKTDAKQSNRNLLLTPEGTVDTMPQLLIYADDVKCTHGATVGALDENAAFYLRSRGVPDKAARGLLTFAFANEILEGFRVEGLRSQLQEILLRRFTEGEEDA
jgi:Fe-S cluster assembly protein SufD